MKSGNRWKDHYTERAKNEKWLARSVYKLEEIDKKYKIIRKGNHILDLGCYPGSWSQYCIKMVGAGGQVVGLDKTKPNRLTAIHFRFLEADILRIKTGWLRHQVGRMDGVISDLAPQTTGIRDVDTSRSLELAERALEIAMAVLKDNGYFLCKVFEGEGFKTFKDQVSRHFRRTRSVRPSAIRKRSTEIYLLGIGFIELYGG